MPSAPAILPAVRVYLGEALAAYHFGPDHPFGPLRYPAFVAEFRRRGLDRRVQLGVPAQAARATLERFHTPAQVDRVMRASLSGSGLLDLGDTPAFGGVYEAAATVVGTVVAAVDAILAGECSQAFVPIAGLHHARRDGAAGFCVFNDVGVAIEHLRARGIERIAYVDIDAHHGDGVFYAFEEDPQLFIADFHEDGRYLYPGSGAAAETGHGAARGTKRNFPMPPGADDALFRARWPEAEAFLEAARPQFVLLQCGADSLRGDPITHLGYTSATHRFVTERLRSLAQRHCGGHLLALGGGGYDPANLAAAWCAVIEALIDEEGTHPTP